MDANLLITYDPNHEGLAKQEVENLMKEIGKTYEIIKEDSGILMLKVDDAKEVVKKMREIAEQNKDKFNKTFKWIPIERWTKATIEDMQSVIKEVQEGIGEEERWAMSLDKRRTELHEKDLIIKLTEPVEKKNVDLSNPEKIIWVEIIGDEAGISLLKPDEILEVAKLK